MRAAAAIFCFLAGTFLVTANPLTQVIPVQSCPCNQNANAPLNVPILLQQNLPQQMPVLFQQTPNNNLYSQPVIVQNQVPTCPNSMINQANQIQLANEVNPGTRQINQAYMQRILTNPTIQSILDLNNKLYNQATEIPKQLSGQASGSIPNVVNNYFILPPEYFQNEVDNVTPKRKPKNDERQSRPNLEKQTYRGTASENSRNGDIRNNPPRQRENRKTRLTNGEFNRAIDHIEDSTDRHRHRRKEKNNNNRRHDMNNPRGYRQGNNPRQIKRPHNGRETPLSSSEKEIFLKFETAPKDRKGNQEFNSKDHTDIIESKDKGRGKSKITNDDKFIKDFRTKFPGIPEEVVRSLLTYLRRQLQREKLGHPWFYNPDATFPLRYDQLFPNSRMFDFGRNVKRRQPNRRSPPRTVQRQKQDLKLTTINTDPTTTNHPTTVKSIDQNGTKSNKDKHNEAKVSVNNKKVPDEFVTTTETNTPELGDEDEIDDIHNGIIDDYYPNFRHDRAYFESDEVYTIRNLRDNRYYYTTDRNYERDQLKVKSGYQNSFEDVEDSLHKPFDVETESISELDEKDILQFRTPPALEMPNFQTKQIVKEKPDNEKHRDIKSDVVLNKSSTYSEAKDNQYKETKSHKINVKPKKSKGDDIEMVYAHSKVAKYGKVDDGDEENGKPVVTYYIPDNMQFEDDGKTVVIAKSISPDHFW